MTPDVPDDDQNVPDWVRRARGNPSDGAPADHPSPDPQQEARPPWEQPQQPQQPAGQQWEQPQQPAQQQWEQPQQQWEQPAQQQWEQPQQPAGDQQWVGYGQPQGGAYGQPQGAQWNPGATQAGEVSGWGSRVGAFLLDGLVAGVPAVIGGGLIGVASASSDPSAVLIGIAVVLYVATLAISLWNRCYLAGKTGQSLGKRWTGQYLVGEQTGQPIGFGNAFVREICHILDGFCYIGYILAAFDDRTQTFADKIMKTVVVRR